MARRRKKTSEAVEAAGKKEGNRKSDRDAHGNGHGNGNGNDKHVAEHREKHDREKEDPRNIATAVKPVDTAATAATATAQHQHHHPAHASHHPRDHPSRCRRCCGGCTIFLLLLALTGALLLALRFYLLHHPDALPVLPALPDLPPELQEQWQRLNSVLNASDLRPGITASRAGVHAHHPVFLVPGICSSTLEVWRHKPCASQYFRQRMFGAPSMFQMLLFSPRCWLEHLMLDPQTGFDPPGVRLRASVGMESADYLFGVYWVWAKIIENLALIGYDTNSMFMRAYDWRLSPHHLELRDAYFTKLKNDIELAHATNRYGAKAVIVSHSMGGMVTHYFLQWVERQHRAELRAAERRRQRRRRQHQRRSSGRHAESQSTNSSSPSSSPSPSWVDLHIESIVNIGSPMLGVPKGFASLFSGEMRESAELAPILDYWRQRIVLTQGETRALLRSFPSVFNMIPKGGNAVWGDVDDTPDDVQCARAGAAGGSASTSTGSSGSSGTGDDDYRASTDAASPSQASCVCTAAADASERRSARGSARGLFVTVHDTQPPVPNATRSPPSPSLPSTYDLTLSEALEWFQRDDPAFYHRITGLYSVGHDVAAALRPNVTVEGHKDGHDDGDDDPRRWTNPLESPLPHAPHLNVYCLYGVGRESERGYVYTRQSVALANDSTASKSASATSASTSSSATTSAATSSSSSVDFPTPAWAINTSHSVLSAQVVKGIKRSDGDGTVPLVSLSFMCVKGWRETRWNPAGARIVAREFRDEGPALPLIRSSSSSDHVDILGNNEVISDLIRVVGKRRIAPHTPRGRSSESASAGASAAAAAAAASSGEHDAGHRRDIAVDRHYRIDDADQHAVLRSLHDLLGRANRKVAQVAQSVQSVAASRPHDSASPAAHAAHHHDVQDHADADAGQQQQHSSPSAVVEFVSDAHLVQDRIISCSRQIGERVNEKLAAAMMAEQQHQPR